MLFIILFRPVGKLFWASSELAVLFDLNVVQFIENQDEDRDFDLITLLKRKKMELKYVKDYVTLKPIGMISLDSLYCEGSV